mgnify:CR=1 FL=1
MKWLTQLFKISSFIKSKPKEKDWASIDNECNIFTKSMIDQANHDIHVLNVSEPFNSIGEFIEFEMSGAGGEEAYRISQIHEINISVARCSVRAAYRNNLRMVSQKPYTER